MGRCIDSLLKQTDFGGVVLGCLGAFGLLAKVMRQAALKTSVPRRIEFVRDVGRLSPVARALINAEQCQMCLLCESGAF